MKKSISIILVTVFMLGTLFPLMSSAASKYADIPIICLRGDADPIYAADGVTKVFPVEVSTEEITDMVKKDIYPALLKAVLFNQWDAYYDAFEGVLKSVYGNCSLDNNGSPSNGTDISPKKYAKNEYNMQHDLVKSNGQYDLYAYTFWYDWRLDPFEIADRLHEYIQQVRETTGAKRVSLMGRCLGGSFIFAYFEKYGYEGIYNLALDSTVANGAEKFSDLVSGRLLFDGEAFEREQRDDLVYDSEEDSYDFSDYLTLINELIVAGVDLLNENGKMEISEKLFEKLYAKMKDDMLPRLVMATYGTFPGYWTCVLKEDYQTAKNTVFNTDALKTQYAGLIAKLDYYDEHVRQKIPEILKNAKENDVDIGIVVKYGYQLSPFMESRNELSDTLVNAKTASFGATCANIGETLPQSYLESVTQSGRGQYLSPDKMIDASTCLFPDSTWFVKGIAHNCWPDSINSLIYKISTYRGQMTVLTEDNYPQYMVFDKNTFKLSAMTETNNSVENFDAGEVSDHGIKSYFKALKVFFQKLRDFLKAFFIRKLKD